MNLKKPCYNSIHIIFCRSYNKYKILCILYGSKWIVHSSMMAIIKEDENSNTSRKRVVESSE
jgi:hypothetical protein